VNNPNSDPHVTVKMLLRNGADVRFQDRAGCTALYYAIVNGWPKTVELLMRTDPTLTSSLMTIPLFVALGAHRFHASDVDIRRLAVLPPQPHVLLQVVRKVRSIDLVKIALAVMEGKLERRVVTPDDGQWKGWKQPNNIKVVGRLSLSQMKVIDEVVLQHGEMVRLHYRNEAKECIRLLRMHHFYLTCQEVLRKCNEGTLNDPELSYDI
jgi:hypothetical protein